MTKYLVFVFFLITCFHIQAQKEEELSKSEKIIKRGVELHEEKKYQEAINEFNKINSNDFYYEKALYEKGYSYFSRKQFDSTLSICKQARDLEIGDRSNFYIIEANALDETKQTDEALKIYNKAIETYPQNHLLYFNKGVCLEKAERLQEALDNYKQAVYINPFHPASHLRLAQLAFKEGLLTQALLSINTYLLIKPASTGSVDVIIYAEKMTTKKYEEQQQTLIFSKEGDNFDEVEAILRNQLALNKKYKIESKIDLPFLRQTQVLMTYMGKHEGTTGFYEKVYVPIFKKMYNNNFFEIYTYYILQSASRADIEKIVKKNQPKIKELNTWILDNVFNLMTVRENLLNGKKQTVTQIYKNGFLYGFGKVENNKKEGEWEFYQMSGRLLSTLSFKNDQLNGVAKYYTDKGTFNSEKNFSGGKLDGRFFVNYYNGNIKEEGTYKSDTLEGVYKYYYLSGGLKYLANYKSGKFEGSLIEYYQNGNIKSEMTYKGGKLQGEVKGYYPDKKLEYTTNFINGLKEGKKQTFYPDGSLASVENFVGDKSNGEYKSYFKNGKVKVEGITKNSNIVGEYKTYYQSGVLSTKRNFDKDGNITGTISFYDEDGLLYDESQIVKDKLVAFKYFDKKGNVLRDVKIKDDVPIEYLRSDGSVASVNIFKQKELEGERKEFFRNGKVSGIVNYSKGLMDGIRTLYFKNGQISSTVNFIKGEQDGEYVGYHRNGKVKITGRYDNGFQDGEWKEFYPDGILKYKYFYQNHELQGNYETYTSQGKLYELEHYHQGIPEWVAKYDSTGKEIFKINLQVPGKREVKMKGINDFETYVSTYENSKLNGLSECLLSNGGKIFSGNYINGLKYGIWKIFGPSGKPSVERNTVAGENEGSHKSYDEVGNLLSETTYSDGEINGIFKKYYHTGKLYYEDENEGGEENGFKKYYGSNGELILQVKNNHDDIIYFIRNNKNGELKDTVYIKNETATIKANYKSGKPAIEMNYLNGFVDGKYVVYTADGKPFLESNYKSGLLEGERKTYFESGSIYMIERFKDGDNDGAVEVFWENGKQRAIVNYRKDNFDGISKTFDKDGKLLETRTYYNNDVINISKN